MGKSKVKARQSPSNSVASPQPSAAQVIAMQLPITLMRALLMREGSQGRSRNPARSLKDSNSRKSMKIDHDQIQNAALLAAFARLQERQIASGLTSEQHADCLCNALEKAGIAFNPEQKLIAFLIFAKIGNASALRQAAESKSILKKKSAGGSILSEYLPETSA